MQEVDRPTAVGRWYFFAAAFGLAILPGMAAAIAGMLFLQQSYLPVVDRFSVEQLTLDEAGDAVIDGEFRKRYPGWMCRYKNMQWFMVVQDSHGSEMLLRIDASYADTRQSKSDNSRPGGMNKFHSWRLGVSEYPALRSVRGYAMHQCLGLFPARTHLTDLDIDEWGANDAP